MHILRGCRIVAVLAVFALIGAIGLGGAAHAGMTAAHATSSDCGHGEDDGGDGMSSALSCQLACAGLGVIGERVALTRAPAPGDHFDPLLAASSGVNAPPDPYPPRHDA